VPRSIESDNTSPPSNGDWNEYRRLVLRAVDKLEVAVDTLRDAVAEIRAKDVARIESDLAVLKTKAAMWGAASGMISGAIITWLVLRVLK
jgi:hypothetical protein